MAAKIILALCAQALLVQSAFSQCAAGLAAPWGVAGSAGWNGQASPGLAAPGLAAYGAAGCSGVASTGGGFPVTSVSPIAPTGISIISENAIEGPLAVGGNLPFLGSVAIEGVLPTAGAGSVSYGCGNGEVNIVSEVPLTTGIVGPAPFGPAGPAYGPAGPAYGPAVPAYGPAGPAYGPAPGAYGPALYGAPAYNGLPGYGCGAIF